MESFHFTLGVAEKVGKVSIKILNFASLLMGMSVPSRRTTKFIWSIWGVTANTVIIYAIFVNTQEMVVLFSFRRSTDLLLKTLDITIRKHLMLKMESSYLFVMVSIEQKYSCFSHSLKLGM